MNDGQAKALCLDLMKTDSEDGVVVLLRDAGFWDMQAYWRYYGDYENNYNTAGNQQARPDPALVEKLIKSVDARLMKECLARGIDPAGNAAPASIREAVATFFEDGATADKPYAGQIKYWANEKRTQVARGITLAATGAKPPGKPCFSIADSGEGQTPEKMPDSLLSLNKSNNSASPSSRVSSTWAAPACSSSAASETCNWWSPAGVPQSFVDALITHQTPSGASPSLGARTQATADGVLSTPTSRR